MALFLLRAAGTFPGETWNFTNHVTSSSSVGTVADAFAAALTTLWSGDGTQAGLAPLFASDVVLETATASGLEQATGQQLTREDRNMDVAGTSTASSLPPQVAVVISLATAVANRSGRGRFYLPALAADTLAAGRVSSATTDAIVAACDAYFSALAAASLVLVIYGRTSHDTTQVTGASVGDVFDTQRRRRDKLIESRSSITV